MNETTGLWRNLSQPLFASVPLPSAALSGVRTRRIMALCLDFLIVSCLAFGIWLVLLVLTLGLSLFVLPPLFPLVAFFYNGLSVSGSRMATPGMRMMDLQMRMTDGGRVPFLNAAVHAVLFYISWLYPVVFLISLLMSDKRCLHDMLAGVIVVRRPNAFPG
ncbi:MAG: RDD family protein [Methylovirgula sp.]